MEELTLPVRIDDKDRPHFGIGVTSATHTAHAAYLASRVATHAAVETLLRKALPDVALTKDTPATNALNSFRSRLAAIKVDDDTSTDHPTTTTTTTVCQTPPGPQQRDLTTTEQPLSEHHLSMQQISDKQATQKQLCDIITRARITRAIKKGDERTRLLRKSLALPNAKEWLLCQPIPGASAYIGNRDFRTWFAFYVRRPLFNPSTTSHSTRCIRPRCRDAMDIHGDHLLWCPAATRTTTAPATRRHDQLVRLIASDLRDAARAPQVEPRDTFTTAHSRVSRPDIVTLGDKGGEDLLDFVATHLLSSPEAIRRNNDCPRTQLNHLHSEKRRQHAEYSGHRPGSRIVPLVTAVTGGWHGASHQYLTSLASEIASRTLTPAPVVTARMFRRYAARLIAGNARCLLGGAVD